MAHHFEKHAIDQHSFVKFCKKLRQSSKEEELILAVDNLPVHHTATVKDYCAPAGIRLLYLPIYSSPFNPIEHLWAYSKQRFRKRLINFDWNGGRKKVSQLVEDCVHEVPVELMGRLSKKLLGR